MSLRFDRFRKFPENAKIATLIGNVFLGLYLIVVDVHYDAETRFLWFSLWNSLAFDAITILILLKEWDENVEFLRRAPYELLHTLASLAISFIIFVSGIMFLVTESYSGHCHFFVGAFFCLAIFGIRMVCVLKALPQVLADLQHPGRPTNAEYDNDGTSMV